MAKKTKRSKKLAPAPSPRAEKRPARGYMVKLLPRETVSSDNKVVKFHGRQVGPTTYLMHYVDDQPRVRFATLEAVQARLEQTRALETTVALPGTTPMPTRLVRIVGRVPLGWKLTLRVAGNELVMGTWMKPTPGYSSTDRQDRLRWFRELVESLGRAEPNSHLRSVPHLWPLWRHYRRRWTPIYSASHHVPQITELPWVVDDRHNIRLPPGWHVAGWRLEVTENGVRGRVVKLRRPAMNGALPEPGMIEPVQKGGGLVMTGQVDKALEHLVRWGKPRRLVCVYKPGARVTTKESCAKRRQFNTFEAAFGAASKASSAYGKPMEAHGCGICGKWHIGRKGRT